MHKTTILSMYEIETKKSPYLPSCSPVQYGKQAKSQNQNKINSMMVRRFVRATEEIIMNYNYGRLQKRAPLSTFEL